jgi:GntR family transcriptional regulator
VPEGSPLMLVERTAYAADGTAVEFAHDRHRGDRARFTIETAADVPAHV